MASLRFGRNKRSVVSMLGFAAVSVFVGCDQEVDRPPPILGDDGQIVHSGGSQSIISGASQSLSVSPLAIADTADRPRRSIQLLANNTTLPGDNVIILETAMAGSIPVSPISKLADMPSALDAFGPQATWRFKTVSDHSGPINVISAEPFPGVICVAATRTGSGIGSSGAFVGGFTTTTLRNCVTGTEAQALAPILQSNSG